MDRCFAFADVTYRGGSIAGIEVLVSSGVSSGTMILVDAAQVAAASETVTLSASDQASVQMEDAALDSLPTASTSIVSLWQNDMIGLRAERFFSATKLTTTGVCVVTGVAYTGDSPGP